MSHISNLMYHVIHDDHLEIKLIVLYCIVLYNALLDRLPLWRRRLRTVCVEMLTPRAFVN